MLILGKITENSDQARSIMAEKIKSGAALAKFQSLIEAQGGDGSVVDDPDKLPSAATKTQIIANKFGYISDIDAYGIGMAATALGAGRATAEDTIDPGVGIELTQKCGTRVQEGAILATVHHNHDLGPIRDQISKAFTITDSYDVPGPLVIDQIRS